MTSTATTTSGTVRRAAEPSPLLPTDALPPGQHFIAGEFRPGTTNETQSVVDPCTEATICEVAQGTAADADAAVLAALEAKEAWGRTLPKKRRRSFWPSPTVWPRTQTCWPGSKH